jgi:HAD superfamily hydrolase (TIGR01509 family)
MIPGRVELEAVLFDAGGTLIELDFAFMAQRAQAAGVRIGPESLRRAEGAARRAIDRGAGPHGALDRDEQRVGGYFGAILRAAGIPRDVISALSGALEVAHAHDNLWRVPLVGAVETLRELRARGLRTAVVSNADGRVQRTLEAAGLTPHLELVVDSHFEGVEKPDPEIFRRALERLGVAAERAAYVGDIYSIDALGARAAGLAPVLIDRSGVYADSDCPTIAALAELLGEGGPGAARW